MNKKKPSITKLQKDMKSLEETNIALRSKNYSLENKNESLQKELNETKDKLSRFQASENYSGGKVEGMLIVLNKLHIDSNITFTEIKEVGNEQSFGGRY